MKDEKQLLLRSLPAVHKLLNMKEMVEWKQGKELDDVDILPIIQTLLAEERREILAGHFTPSRQEQYGLPDFWLRKIESKINQLYRLNLQRVINGTGIILHTNLGRAVLSEKAISHVVQTAGSYSNLEYQIAEGVRGSRHSHVEDLLTRITGAEAAMVVNNNAAAVFLVLREMARGQEVLVSRGQLVEIGGSFRISEIMEESGAFLREVGTTNKTHPQDYERKIGPETALLMKVHTSNFRVVGFTRETSLRELVELGLQYNVPVYEDLGSGVLFDLASYGIGNEPVVSQVIGEGADLVSFSGDKLLGGPQAGIIVGKKEYIQLLKKNQLARVLRVDKMTLAALESTLLSYLNPDRAREEIPVLKALLSSPEEIQRKANLFYERLKALSSGFEIQVREDVTEAGGGTLPGITIPTWVVALRLPGDSTASLERKLRLVTPPIIARIQEDWIILDFRTIKEEEIEEMVSLFENL